MRWVSTAALCAALLFGGCAWRGPAPAQVYPGVQKTDSVLALDKAAWRLVAVQNQEVERTEDGRLRVQLEIANLSNLDVAIMMQTQFRDKSDAPMGDATPFQTLVIPGAGTKVYEITSLQINPSRFTVSIKTQ